MTSEAANEIKGARTFCARLRTVERNMGRALWTSLRFSLRIISNGSTIETVEVVRVTKVRVGRKEDVMTF